MPLNLPLLFGPGLWLANTWPAPTAQTDCWQTLPAQQLNGTGTYLPACQWMCVEGETDRQTVLQAWPGHVCSLCVDPRKKAYPSIIIIGNSMPERELLIIGYLYYCVTMAGHLH